MPQQSGDQHSYSVDEMMERLRDEEAEREARESARVVTRPDGTRVIKVRRRKRRSRQPAKEAMLRRKKKKILAVCAVISLFVALGIAVVLLVARYNSRGFQEEFGGKVGGALGGQASIDRLEVTPLRAHAFGMSVTWPEASAVKVLKLRDVEANLRLTSLLGSEWRGEEVRARSGLLQLGAPLGGQGEAEANPPWPLDFGQYRCSELTIGFGGGDKPPVYIEGTEATLRPDEGQGTVVLLKRGEFVLEGWEPMRIDVGNAGFFGGMMDLQSLRIVPEDGIGELNFATKNPCLFDGNLDLAIEAEDFALSVLVGSHLGKLMDARVTGNDGVVTMKDWDFETLDARLEFAGSGGKLVDFSFLNNLRTIFGDTDFGKPHFAKVSGVLRRDRYGTRIQNLEMEHPGQLSVRGTIETDRAGELSGTLKVGVREGKILSATGRKRYSAFSNPDNGYCWITIELSGTAADPADNLSRLLHRRVDALDDGSAQDLLEKQFEQLTR